MDAWHDALADAHRQGSPYSISGIHIWRGYTHFLRGELIDACADLEEAVAGVPALRLLGNVMAYAASFLARALTERGELGARPRGPRVGPPRLAQRGRRGHRYFRNARLELLVAEGLWDEVPAAAMEARRRIAGWVNPLGHRWRSLWALALVGQRLSRGGGARWSRPSWRTPVGGRPGYGRRASVSSPPCWRSRAAARGGRGARGLAGAAGAREGALRSRRGRRRPVALRRALNLALGGGADPVATRARSALAALGADARSARRRRPDLGRAPRARPRPRRRRGPRDRRGALPRARSRSPATSPPPERSSPADRRWWARIPGPMLAARCALVSIASALGRHAGVTRAARRRGSRSPGRARGSAAAR